MFLPSFDISIGDYSFTALVDGEIVQDAESLTATATLSIPRRYEWNLRNIALGDDPIIKRKDKVVIKYGYDGQMRTEFIGYIKEVKSGVPVRIECEDSMMLLKEKAGTWSFSASTTLKQVLSAVLPKDVSFVCLDDIIVGQYRFSDVTPAMILDELRSKFGLRSYFRLLPDNDDVKPVLHVGWMYWLDNRQVADFAFGQNWRDGMGLIIKSDDLTYRRAEDIRLRIKVVNIQSDNQRKEYEFGDPDGETRTLHYYKADAATVKANAAKEMERLKYTGWRGSFSTFGEPSVSVGDVAVIKGNEYHPDGMYLIKKVTKKFGLTTGIRQQIEPHRLITNLNEI
jgi:hypothetical protein